MDWHFYAIRGMNYFQAMRLLDKVKDGIPIPLRLITEALILTGDLDE